MPAGQGRPVRASGFGEARLPGSIADELSFNLEL